MTLRRLGALLKFLPRDSALAIVENGGREPFSLEAHLLADLWLATVAPNIKKKSDRPDDHPLRAERMKKVAAAKARARRSKHELAQQRVQARIEAQKRRAAQQ